MYLYNDTEITVENFLQIGALVLYFFLTLFTESYLFNEYS